MLNVSTLLVLSVLCAALLIVYEKDLNHVMMGPPS
jgi:hypothetical protein